MKIIIAEKPSVAREYARVLHASGDMKNGYLEGNDWIVTWTVGHLVQMSYPENYNPVFKEWRLETLPFLPDEFKYEIIPSVKHQFHVVKKLYNRPDIKEIYYAGDSGREGLYIQMLVRMLAGHNASANEKVVWIDSQTDDEILRGVAEAKPLKAYENLSDAGYLRAKEDYLVGINFSRLLTLLYGAMVNTGSGQKGRTPIAVGRVMSCVLGMITRREREIRAFRPTEFFRIAGAIHLEGAEIKCEWRETKDSRYAGSPKLYSEVGFKQESDANELISALSDSVRILSVENLLEKKNAPLLFNLAELQGECTRLFHISPAETLSVVQSLYEQKLTTYPRTDARVLSSAVASEIQKNLSGLGRSEYSVFATEILARHYTLKGKYVDDSQITDHYAIIPTGKVAENLKGIEKSVYDRIVRRFLAAFYPPAEYEKVKFEAESNGEHFFGNAKYLLKKGYYEVSGLPKEENSNRTIADAMSHLQKGRNYPVSYSIKKGMTQAPKRYTSGSLVLAMENAGNLIESEELREQIKGNGIGTSATRADTIEKLISKRYIALDKKQIITPTNFGEMIFEVMDGTMPDFLSPEITAEWERRLQDVENGRTSKQSFEADLFEYVRKTCDDIKKGRETGAEAVKERIRKYATNGIRDEYHEFESWNTKLSCPLCGDEIETTEWGFRCKSYKGKNEGCPFSIGDLLGHKLLTRELSDLLTKKKIGPFYDFVSTKGKPFAAYVLWDAEVKKISFDFTDMPWEETDLSCPGCGKKILNQGKMYRCAGYIDREHGCNFWVNKICGKTLQKKDVECLVNKGETELIRGFKNKDGKVFDAFLAWDSGKKEIVFRFPVSDEIRTNMKCPICGGSILRIPTGYKCEKNLSKEEGCSFYVGTILSHKIKEKELELILRGEETELLSLKSGEGDSQKEFQAHLFWNTDDKRIALRFEENTRIPIRTNCPICGQSMVKTKYGYQCSSKKKDGGCPFFFGSIAGISLEPNQVEKLLNEGKTDLITGFQSKQKKKFSAYLVWDPEGKKITFQFPDSTPKKSAFSCPCCNGSLRKGMYGYYCDCGFRVNREIAGKELEEAQIRKLIVNGETDWIDGFFSARKRSMFRAKLGIDKNAKKVVFKVEDRKKTMSQGSPVDAG